MNPEIAALFDLRGKTAVIIGGAVHLGYDMASVLAAAGCAVALTSRERDRAQQSADTLRKAYGVDSLGAALDHTQPEAVAEFFASLSAWKPSLDIAINNAGGGSGAGVCDLLKRDPADMDRLLQLNLNGVLYCCQAAARRMVAQRSGAIVNIASIAGLIGRDRRMYARNGMAGQPVDYAAAKAGIIGLTLDLAATLAPHGIRVNCISPGGFNRNLPEGFVRDYSDRTPLGRMGRDGIDIKGPLLFLVSPAADYVTGHNLVVDGGFSQWK